MNKSWPYLTGLCVAACTHQPPCAATFRRGIALVLLLQALTLLPDAVPLFDGSGYFRTELIDTRSSPVFRTHDLEVLLTTSGFGAGVMTRIVFGIYIASLLTIVLNGTSVLPVLLIVVFTKAMWSRNCPYVSYGVDNYTTICLSCCVLSSLMERDKADLLVAIWLRVILSLGYFASGVEKASGIDWWTGESIWRACHFADSCWPLRCLIGPMPALAAVAGWATIVVELGYPFAILFARTRRTWISAIVVMHLGIMLFMELHFFGAVMILMNVTAWGPLGRSLICHDSGHSEAVCQ